MNKIIIDGKKITSDINGINIIENDIILNEDIDLFIEIKSSINLSITASENIKSNIFIYINGNGLNLNFEFNSKFNSNLKITRYNNVKLIKEKTIINLLEDRGCIEYITKTISDSQDDYECIINHKSKNTICNVYNNALNTNDNITFNVSSFIKKGIKGCISNQFNKIVNLSNDVCTIKPNLYIDEFDVIANHSAYIGKFSKEDIFYLESRGINYLNSLKLLSKGFLIKLVENDELKDLINKDLEKKVKYE